MRPSARPAISRTRGSACRSPAAIAASVESRRSSATRIAPISAESARVCARPGAGASSRRRIQIFFIGSRIRGQCRRQVREYGVGGWFSRSRIRWCDRLDSVLHETIC
jgi:hypothetical protein